VNGRNTQETRKKNGSIPEGETLWWSSGPLYDLLSLSHTLHHTNIFPWFSGPSPASPQKELSKTGCPGGEWKKNGRENGSSYYGYIWVHGYKSDVIYVHDCPIFTSWCLCRIIVFNAVCAGLPMHMPNLGCCDIIWAAMLACEIWHSSAGVCWCRLVSENIAAVAHIRACPHVVFPKHVLKFMCVMLCVCDVISCQVQVFRDTAGSRQMPYNVKFSVFSSNLRGSILHAARAP